MQFLIKLIITAIINSILLRLIEPLKYKIKFYQVVILLHIDQLLIRINSKYDFMKEKLTEQKIKLKVLKFKQSQFRVLETNESNSTRSKDFNLFGKFEQ